MARGWESKSVEDQMGAAEEERAARRKPGLTDEQRERQATRDSLLLARTRILKDLEGAADTRYRAMLEGALGHLDARLADTEGPPD